MKADELSVGDVLRNAKERYVVPLYQRKYQWHDEREGARVRGFWQDIAAKASDVVEGDAKFVHYMGALLMAPGSEKRPNAISAFQVVDGQQRLTTFLLLFAALRQVALRHGCEELAEDCKQYLFTDPGRADTDKLSRYKLMPTPHDRDVFCDILDSDLETVRTRYRKFYNGWGGKVAKNTPMRALRAYEFFVTQINDFATKGPRDETVVDVDADEAEQSVDQDESDDATPASKRLEALFDAVIGSLKLIVITLDEEDDAQVIFETLNSAGQPLRAMDLVRNNIFHRAETSHGGDGNGRERTETLYDEVWKPFDAPWWEDDAPNARPKKPRIDHFLAHVLGAETGKRITVRELYAEYRAWAIPDRRPLFADVKDELAILQKYVPAYEDLEARTEHDKSLAWLGRRLRVWQNTTAYPVAFQVAVAELQAKDRDEIVRLINSYVTRRALCELTAKNLNRVFPRLAGALVRDGVSVGTVQAFFRDLSGPATRFPDDAELTRGIVQKPAYDRLSSQALQHVLWQLEIASRSIKTEATERPEGLQIEHVMPRGWRTHWPLREGVELPEGVEDPRIRERSDAIHTLGNLTIVTERLNPSMSNGSFEDKKAALQEHSNLTLNKRLAGYDTWDEDAIRARGAELATLAVRIWPSLPPLD